VRVKQQRNTKSHKRRNRTFSLALPEGVKENERKTDVARRWQDGNGVVEEFGFDSREGVEEWDLCWDIQCITDV